MKSIEGKYTYRPDIDALRGIAVLLVVLFHAFPFIFPGGFIGVDVFFIISGYLITQIIVKELETERFSIINFYTRRIKRLLPALCSVVSFSLIIGWLILYPDEYKKLGYHAYRSLLFTQNLNLISESGYFDISSHYKPLLHLWSLSVEEQFYLVWPLMLYICIKLGQKSLVFICIIFLVSFYLNIHFINLIPTKTFYHIYYRFWELGMGCLLALSYQYFSLDRFKGGYCKSFGFLGVLLIVCSAFIFNEKLRYPSWYAFIPTIGAILFIHARFSLKKWFGLRKLGLISYPLYLWHWVILSFLHIYFSKQLTNNIILVGLILSMIMSFLTFRYIEKFRYSTNKYVVHCLLGWMFVIGIFAYVLHSYDGLPERYHLGYLKKYNLEFQRTHVVDDACIAYVKKLKVKRDFFYCRADFNFNDKPIIAVIGDSHAHAFYAGIQNISREKGYNSILLANSSCPPLKGFISDYTNPESHGCQEKIGQILETIKLDKKIDKVVMVTRGPVYIHGEVNGKFSYKSIQESLNNYRDKDVLSYENYAKGFYSTIRVLSDFSHIKNIYYYFENPELDFEPKETIHRPYTSDEIDLKIKVSKRLYLMRMKKYRKEILKFSRLYGKLIIVNTDNFFCPNEQCDFYKQSNFLYADDDHLSVFGAVKLANATTEIIFPG